MADILIIDDDAGLRLALQMALKRKGHTCRLAENLQQGYTEWTRRGPDLTLLDLRLPDGSGLELLARIRERGVRCRVIVMTAFGTVSSAVSAMKGGAIEFIEKPPSVDEVCQVITRTLEDRHLVSPPASTDDDLMADRPAVLIGDGPDIRDIRAKAQKIARLASDAQIGPISTLIIGETGSGKEQLARYIHDQAGLAPNAFVRVRCMTGMEMPFANQRSEPTRPDGKAEPSSTPLESPAVGQGTLFLESVGDMPLEQQANLLAAIETGSLPGIDARAVDFRQWLIIATTESDLTDKIDAGQFRSDLYHRLKMFQIHMPALRDQGEDLFRLADYFLNRFSVKLRRPAFELSDDARQRMKAYSWPGNVRELAHALLSATALSDSRVIHADALDLGSSQGAKATATGAEAIPVDFAAGGLSLDELERHLIKAAFEHAKGNVSEAARLLGMPRGTLRYRLQKMGLS